MPERLHERDDGGRPKESLLIAAFISRTSLQARSLGWILRAKEKSDLKKKMLRDGDLVSVVYVTRNTEAYF